MALKESTQPDVKPTVYNLMVLEKIGDNLFVCFGSARVRRVAVQNRNMVVLRHNKRDLTLINPIRLDEEGEQRLLRLGRIQRIIRAAPCHGLSHDLYYLEKFPTVRRWAPQSKADHLPVDRVISEDDNAILPGCHVFTFHHTEEPECAFLILQDYLGNLIVTADALQSQKDNPYINAITRLRFSSNGMLESDIGISKSWIKTMGHTIESRKGLKDDFERLLHLDFERLVGSSGVMVYKGAKERAVMAVELGQPYWE